MPRRVCGTCPKQALQKIERVLEALSKKKRRVLKHSQKSLRAAQCPVWHALV